MSKKRSEHRLKLPDDFLGTVTALLNTKPPKKAKRKSSKGRKKGPNR